MFSWCFWPFCDLFAVFSWRFRAVFVTFSSCFGCFSVSNGADDVIYDGRCHRCHCQSSLFVDVIGLLLLMSYSFSILFSFPPMMVIIAVLSSQSLDDPFHVLTTTTHDDDLLESLMSSYF